MVFRYTFRSGNVEHVSDKFYNTNVEVLAANKANFTVVGSFDEFGLAEGDIKKELNPLTAIRLIVDKDSQYWVILSEVGIEMVLITDFKNKRDIGLLDLHIRFKIYTN